MSRSSWALQLAGLGRRIASLEQALEEGPDAPEGPDGPEGPDAPEALQLDPWAPPEAMDGPPTPEQRRHFEELMVRLDACRTGVARSARDLASHVGEDHQRRAAARRYTRP